MPNGVTVKNVLVSCSDLGDDIDVLIGMDIIKHGDFAITNVNGKTTFSFRTPSIQEIDYVKESKLIDKEQEISPAFYLIDVILYSIMKRHNLVLEFCHKSMLNIKTLPIR